MSYKRSCLLGVLAVCLLVVGCGKDDDKTPRELLQGDLSAFATEVVEGLSGAKAERFQQVFGGNTGAHVKSYLSERLKHFIEFSDLSSKSRAWLERESDEKKAKDLTLGALNIGTSLWLQSLISEKPVVLSINGETVPVDSSRVGIVLLGPGYTSVWKNNGREIPVPSAFRRGILVHEARHSDCTGGVTVKGIETARKATSYEQFRKEFPHAECGHMHSLCSEKHEFAGLPVCDDKPWGAYMIGWLYHEAQLRSRWPGDANGEWEILTMAALDYERRLEFNRAEAIESSAPAPDMTSQGLIP